MPQSLNNPYTIIQEGLRVLPKRTNNIIARRFGISQKEPETLEAIGRSYGITRERVRQIEESGLRRLKRDEAFILFKPVVARMENYLRSYGDLRREDSLLNDAVSLYFSKTQSGRKEAGGCPAAINLILTLSEPFQYFRATDMLHSLWTINRESLKAAQGVIGSLINYLESRGDTLNEKDIINWLAKEASHIPIDAHLSYLDAARIIGRNIFGEYGLVHWPVVKPRGVRDRAYLIFKKEKRPLHFVETADLINKLGVFPRRAHAQTVHNELIKDKRFVLVGRGLYALAEWGYSPGTVTDIIRYVLQDAKRPMTKQEIVDEVLKKRIVKASTIVLNIQSSSEFQRTEEGYVLRQ